MLKRLRNASCHLEEGWILELAGELCLELGVRRPVRFYISELVSSPFVEGTGTYHVILPGNIRDCGETELMLRHELTHCARGDLCYRRHLYWLCALYWFLPPVYGYAERFVEVNEMACDEAVLRSVPGKARYRYARLMYDLASENGERSFAETGFSFSGQKDSILERRMKSMVKMKKGMKRWKAAVLSAMLLTLCPATTLAAAGGVSRVQDVVARSMATELEENPIVVETYQEIYEADNYTLVKEAPDMDAMETNLVTRGVSTIDLTINGKVQISIAVVSLSKGDEVTFKLDSDHTTDRFRAGLEDSSGGRVYVNSSNGKILHDFSISKSGTYTLFVEGTTSSEIHVEGFVGI